MYENRPEWLPDEPVAPEREAAREALEKRLAALSAEVDKVSAPTVARADRDALVGLLAAHTWYFTDVKLDRVRQVQAASWLAPYTPTTTEARAEYVANRSIRVSTTVSPAAEFDRWLAAVIRDAKAEARAEIVTELRAKFGVTNRAADYLDRASSPSESEA